MEKQKYQLSPNLHIISSHKSKTKMIYHTLYGNPRIINNEGLRFLNLFRKPVTIEKVSKICDEDPKDIIQEFIEIFFITKLGFDEKKFLREKREQQLIQMQKQQTIDRIGLAISDSCNLRCAHCIHFQPTTNFGKKPPTHQQTISQINMTWKTAKQCIDQYIVLMRKHGKTDGKIHFGNAEPLINWPTIKQALKYCEKINDISFEFSINTNLILMTKQIAEILKKYQVRIATSLDGTKMANDAIRITKNGRGTFSDIIKKFDLLEKIGYPLDGFSITVTKENFELINTDILDLAIKRKMTSIAFDYDLINLMHVPVEQRVSKLIKFKEYANKYGIDFFGTWDSPFRNLTSENFLSTNYAFCAAVQGKSLEFNIEGSIKICGHTTTTVGHINNFNKIFDKGGDLIQIVKNRFPGTNEYCSGCKIEGLCGGQCHVTREVVSRSVVRSQEDFFADMCNFYRRVTEALAIKYLLSNKTTMVGNRQSCAL